MTFVTDGDGCNSHSDRGRCNNDRGFESDGDGGGDHDSSGSDSDAECG